MRPTDKVTVGLLAGSVVTIGVWLIELLSQVPIPAPIAAAATVIVTFGLSYLIPENHPAPTGGS